MKAKMQELSVLKSPVGLGVLTSPIRLEIVGVLQTQGSCAIRELAAHMSRPADGLYHHVRKLERAGVVHVAENRRVGKRDEAIFALAAPRIGGALDPTSPASRAMVIRSGQAVLRMAGRDFVAALESKPTARGSIRPRLSRQKAWLSEEAYNQVKSLLSRVEALLIKQNKLRQGNLVALTTVLTPLVNKSKR
jgi:DNA-binding transcriptional ArsR family regulator